jgi:hypothetical protein
LLEPQSDVVFGERGQRGARIEDLVEISNWIRCSNVFCRWIEVEHRRHQRGKTLAAPNPAAEAIAHRRTVTGLHARRCDMIITFARLTFSRFGA